MTGCSHEQPAMRELFVNDHAGAARGHMLQMVLETLTNMADGAAWPANMIRAERINHDQIGVPFDVFATFFAVVHETFREAAGEAWTERDGRRLDRRARPRGGGVTP
jgi:hypothetical protein